MCLTEKSPVLKVMRINSRLLPIKLHFFFSFGALGTIMPFLPVVGKYLGITATAVGSIYTVISFAVLISKPISGAIADYVQNVKIVMIVLICACLCSVFPILYIPPITQEENHLNVSFIHSIIKCEETSVPINMTNLNFTCLENLVTEYQMYCDLNYKNCSDSKGDRHLIDGCINTSMAETIINSLDVQNVSVSNYDIGNYSCSCSDLTSFFKTSSTCLLKRERAHSEPKSLYKTSQFWTYAILSIIFGACTGSIFSLSDAACYTVLGDESELYGRQRLWGTISWGGATLLTGYLNDEIATEQNVSNYAPGVYLMVALIIIDLVILSFSTLRKTTSSSSICKDVSKIFASLEIIVFAVAVFITGGLTALIWQFQFWFLSDLGASQLLLGITVAFQCLLAETPFFFTSGNLIITFGHMQCLIACFIAYAIRFGLYFWLTNPWWVLPIEILHGLTYGVFYATMTSFANSKAPPGTEATFIGILGGLFEGLGVAVGSLLGGVGFDALKGHYTYLVASIISAVCSILLCFIHYIPKFVSTRQNASIKP